MVKNDWDSEGLVESTYVQQCWIIKNNETPIFIIKRIYLHKPEGEADSMDMIVYQNE